MIIIIDNYDSFTQNLYQYVGELGQDVTIIRNDEIVLQDIANINPTHIIISPGPGKPEESGMCLDIIRKYANKIPILGICLGHQGIGHAYGANIQQINKPMHGKVDNIIHTKEDIFEGLTSPIRATRYHSLVINNKDIPNALEITAWTLDGYIMACRHRIHRTLRGIQFHPESLWTREGKRILKNFLSL